MTHHPTRVTARVTNPSLGGVDELEIYDTDAANDHITIKRKEGGEINIWRGDLRKLISLLNVFLPEGELKG